MKTSVPGETRAAPSAVSSQRGHFNCRLLYYLLSRSRAAGPAGPAGAGHRSQQIREWPQPDRARPETDVTSNHITRHHHLGTLPPFSSAKQKDKQFGNFGCVLKFTASTKCINVHFSEVEVTKTPGKACFSIRQYYRHLLHMFIYHV